MNIKVSDIRIGDKLTYHSGECTVMVRSTPKISKGNGNTYAYMCEVEHIGLKFGGTVTDEFCINTQQANMEDVSEMGANDFSKWVRVGLKPIQVIKHHMV